MVRICIVQMMGIELVKFFESQGAFEHKLPGVIPRVIMRLVLSVSSVAINWLNKKQLSA